MTDRLIGWFVDGSKQNKRVGDAICLFLLVASLTLSFVALPVVVSQTMTRRSEPILTLSPEADRKP